MIAVVVVCLAPAPAAMPFRILLAMDAIPSPVFSLLAPATLLSLVPMIVVLLRALSVVVLGESRAVILTGLAVAVGAGAVVVTICEGESAAEGRECDS